MLVLTVLYGITPIHSWRLTPDSALYIGLGESLAHGDGYSFNGVPHVKAFPGFPLLLSAVVRVFGTEIPTLNILMRLLMVLCVPAVFIVLRHQRESGDPIVVLGTVAAALAPASFESGLFILTEPLAILLSFLLLHRLVLCDQKPRLRNSVLAVALSAIAFMTRPILAAAPVAFLLLALHRRNHPRALFRSALPIAAVVLAAGLWFIRQKSVNPDAPAYTAEIATFLKTWHPDVIWHGLTTVGSHLGWIFFLQRDAPPWLGIPPALLLLIGWRRELRRGLSLISLYLPTYLLLLSFSPHLRLRYLLPVVPLLVFYVFAGAAAVGRAAIAQTGSRMPTGNSVLVKRAIAVGVVVMLLAFAAGDTYVAIRERLASSEITAGSIARRTPHWDPYVLAVLRLKEIAAPGARVLTTHSRVLHVLTQLHGWEPRSYETSTALHEGIDDGTFSYVVVDTPCFDPVGQSRLRELVRAHPQQAQLLFREGACDVYAWHSTSAHGER